MLLLSQLLFLTVRLACPPGTRQGVLNTQAHHVCGELPSGWLQILFVLERVLIGPGCSSRFYADARAGVSALLLCRGR